MNATLPRLALYCLLAALALPLWTSTAAAHTPPAQSYVGWVHACDEGRYITAFAHQSDGFATGMLKAGVQVYRYPYNTTDKSAEAWSWIWIRDTTSFFSIDGALRPGHGVLAASRSGWFAVETSSLSTTACAHAV